MWDCCVGVYGTFCTIPTVDVESYGAGVFFPTRTLIAVKLLNRKINLYLGQFWLHELVRAFNFVLLILVNLNTLNIFG